MMALTRQLGALPARLGLPGLTARLRLTLLYGGLFILAGTGLLGFTFWLFARATGTKVIPTRLSFTAHLRFPQLPGSLPPQRSLPLPGGGHGGARSPVALPCIRYHSHCVTQAVMNRQLRAAAVYANWVDLHALLTRSAIALAVMTVLAFLLGWLVAGRVLRPLRAITLTAETISSTSLHERLALAGPDDEFKKLADTLDGLLARLEGSFAAQRHFVVSASHELRTPLTLDQTVLQVALRNPRTTAEQWRATGEELLESGRQQERILEALLTLATSEAGLARRQPVDLREVAAALLHARRDQLQDRQIQIRASLDHAPLTGDPDLVERLAANLFDNAIQHNTAAGMVEVSTGTEDGQAVLSVENSGPAIPPAEIDRLYRPFQRLAATRASNDNGHGLGLSIVRAIATAHGAVLVTRPRAEGGLRIEATFPRPAHPARGVCRSELPAPAG